MTPISIRRSMGDRDADAIVALHDVVYRAEYDRGDEFVASVARKVTAARAAGWPELGGAVWLVERDGAVAGSLGLTDEGDGGGGVRGVGFGPGGGGRGLGRRLLAELVHTARVNGMVRLELE